MRFISVREFRNSSANIWKVLPKQKEMVITNNGKPIALLTPINDAILEDTLSSIRCAKAMSAVKSIQQQSLKNKTYMFDFKDINTEIKSARKNLKK
jgi:antitoxin (DNA-binding transcriptional repressor) of toxin-antitoxin stability system